MKDAVALPEHRRVVAARHVDDGVEGDDGVEVLGAERERAEVPLDEVGRGGGDSGAGQRQLARREVEAGDPVPGLGEELRHQNPGAAAGVEDAGVGSESGEQLAQEHDVRALTGSLGEVGVGDVVVAARRTTSRGSSRIGRVSPGPGSPPDDFPAGEGRGASVGD